MKISMVASGSKGNLCYIESNEAKILIDAGISCKRFTKFMEENGIDINLDAILITHEHTDHISGLLQISKKYKCPIYMTAGTKKGISEKTNGKDIISNNEIKIIEQNSKFSIKDIEIESFPTFHDVYEPCCYAVKSRNKKLVYITDTGYIPLKLYDILKGADCYVMEVNHDPELLMASSRPYETRIRILGDFGHLSNEDGLELLSNLMDKNCKLVFYAHISEECNLVSIIKEEAKKMYQKMSVDISNVSFVYTNQIATKVYEL